MKMELNLDHATGLSADRAVTLRIYAVKINEVSP